MKIVPASYQIMTKISAGGFDELSKIEIIGRSCYGSEQNVSDSSAHLFVKRLIDRQHFSPLEHSQLTVVFTIDRGVSHEFVRHRLASFMQSSTRYQNYNTLKYHNSITVVDIHPFIKHGTEDYHAWVHHCYAAERQYMFLIEAGYAPEIARAVLPNSLMTKLTVTANYREWRHILSLRADRHAHPQIRQVCVPLLAELQDKIPIIFDDITT